MPNLMELIFSDMSQKREISKAIDLIVKEDTIFLPGEEIKVLKAIEFHGKAKTIEDIIEEVATTRMTERGGRTDDKRSETAMEDRKKEGYF